ncbi:hypothetical protein PUF88_05350 [Lactobacillaceae bacterium L1_55_11]|nr:hypothetical protein [Lactobacillaceae bacterium L1_55_11]
MRFVMEKTYDSAISNRLAELIKGDEKDFDEASELGKYYAAVAYFLDDGDEDTSKSFLDKQIAQDSQVTAYPLDDLEVWFRFSDVDRAVNHDDLLWLNDSDKRLIQDYASRVAKEDEKG